ncbi:hypothetical protein GCM10023206_07500 [Acinetobacter puyangensis]|uniref:Integrase n=1 Tax=Acinetobacter puyangensis TaxID=1096779 RepID=A0A240E8G6_9GAMM|nr:site-specific integrase [Acinetobacter puyangensis]SNX44170.1 integrase [Acinetobacter puyangensis]
MTDEDIAKAKGITVEKESVIVGSGVLFQEVAQKYLRLWDGDLNTKKGYVNTLNFHWMPHLALVPIHTISHDDLRELIVSKEFTTAKTLNNCLIPLRGVFETAMKSKIITENPMAGIENKKVQIGIPDPFSREEMNALLDWLDKNMISEDRFYYWYFEFAFWSGCRPSEMLALKWNDIDWFNSTVRISKSRVRGIEKPVTKTHTIRDVCLNERSKQALTEIRNLRLHPNYVMYCPETGEPFYSEQPARDRLVEAMQGCFIRHRPAYNTRHTYATMMLMDGLNPVFVASQLGHSLEMLMKRYAKWMNGDKNKIEMSKLNTN